MTGGGLLKKAHPLIVGIDPGTTTAIAVLDMRGELLHLMSKKNMSRGDISEHMGRLGRPVIVAADRNPAPFAVEKLASVFSARLVMPRENLSKREKNRLAKELLGDAPEGRPNQHEKDALASAAYAYHEIRPTMMRVEQRLAALGHAQDSKLEDFVKTRVILHRDNVKRAIEWFCKHQ